ncbi:hypothetical protein DIPPA_10960 [Diplonema papillatum]|nr:hypothetical protein DIPPA_10960 [Diplonema papillatum]
MQSPWRQCRPQGPLVNGSAPFWQLNATRMLYSDQPALANWARVPIAAKADLVAHDRSSGQYLVVAGCFSQLWSAAEAGLIAPPATAFVPHPFMAGVAANAAALLLLLLNAVSVAAVPPQGPLVNGSAPFWQLNATRTLYSDQPALANWARVPIAAKADLVAHDRSSGRYLVVAGGFSQLWSAAEAGLIAPPATAFVPHPFMAGVAANAAALLLLLLNAVSVAAVPPQGPLVNGSAPFWQLNATRMLYSDQPALANWAWVPIAAKADLVAHDRSSGRYLVVAGGFSQLWSAAEADLIASPSTAFVSHPSGTPFSNNTGSGAERFVVASLLPGQRFVDAQAAGSNTSGVVFASLSVVSQCSFTSGPSLRCVTLPITTSGNGRFPPQVRRPAALAVSASPLRSAGDQSAVLLATDAGLYNIRVEPGGGAFRAEAVLLANTTGGPSLTSNVTWAGCLPAARYAGGGNNGTAAVGFFGADCFAATNENFTQYGVESDLVHNVAASAAAAVAVVAGRRFERVPGIVDARPTAAVYAPRTGLFHFGNRVCVNAMRSTGAMRRFGGFAYPGSAGKPVPGLPAGNILSGAWLNLSWAHGEMLARGATEQQVRSDRAFEDDGVVFFGTQRGAVALLPQGDEAGEEGAEDSSTSWKLLLGGRWLPGGDDGTLDRGMDVHAMAGGGRSVLAATSTGLSVVHAVVWTAAEKASYFEDVIAPKHQRPDGLFSDIHCEWGNPDACAAYGTANDGLWTGMRLATQAMRYVASNRTDQQARENAWTAFGGLERLINATGVKGLMARSIWQANVTPGAGWVQSPTMPGWWFLCNASSDEVDGHLMAYSVMHALVAETAAEKTRVAALFTDVVTRIVDHGLRLIDYDGTPTQWGHWEPELLNDDPYWYDDQVNCLQIMGWLSFAYGLTGNETFAAVFANLRDEHGYGKNIVSATITQPSDTNWSDFELQAMAYFPLVLSGRGNPLFESIAEEAEESLVRMWRFIKRGQPSLWAALFVVMQPLLNAGGGFAPEHAQLRSEAVAAVRNGVVAFAVDNIDWPVDNSRRQGVTWDPSSARNGQPHANLVNLFPLDELSQFNWNGNPFRATQGSGTSEASPVNYLFPYWVAQAAPYF